MSKLPYIIGVSGHRHLNQPETVRRALFREFKVLRDNAADHGRLVEVSTSAAYGTDILACEEAGKLGIPVHIILPKPVMVDSQTGKLDRHAGFAEDFWDGDTTGNECRFLQEDWDRSYALVQAAVRGDKGWSLKVIVGNHVAPQCFYDAGVEMVMAADVVIAVWDGLPARGLGGTQQMIELALGRGLPLIIISADGESVERHHLDRIVR